ncbi:MAG: hypothetical protein ACTS8R_00485 [Arsenophonus sp. NC-QC1-MAG3]
MVSFRRPALVGSGHISLWKLFDFFSIYGEPDFWKVKTSLSALLLGALDYLYFLLDYCTVIMHMMREKFYS